MFTQNTAPAPHAPEEDRLRAANIRAALAGPKVRRMKAPAMVEPCPRRVGVELEFAKLDVDSAARVVERVFWGRLAQLEPHAAVVETPRDGSFKVVLDTRHAHKCDEDSQAVEEVRRWIGDVASLVVPVEIVCPPLPEQRLAEVDQLVDELRAAGAEGTNAGLLYAFGTHLNVEMAEPNVEAILDTLRAYMLLEEWLRAQIDVNPARSAIGFESRFPIHYQRLVLSPGYQPDKDALIADYVHANPTRNRGLDLLPILAHVDEAAINALLPNEKVSARPAFHYRLPNCQVDEAEWRIRDEMARWRQVEKLAADRKSLDRAMERFELENGWLDSGERVKTSIALGERMTREAPK